MSAAAVHALFYRKAIMTAAMFVPKNFDASHLFKIQQKVGN